MAETDTGSTNGDAQLLSIVERVERLLEEKQTIADDVKEVFSEAVGNGYDAKIIRECIKIRKQDRAEREERDALVETYMQAIERAA